MLLPRHQSSFFHLPGGDTITRDRMHLLTEVQFLYRAHTVLPTKGSTIHKASRKSQLTTSGARSPMYPTGHDGSSATRPQLACHDFGPTLHSGSIASPRPKLFSGHDFAISDTERSLRHLVRMQRCVNMEANEIVLGGLRMQSSVCDFVFWTRDSGAFPFIPAYRIEEEAKF